MRVQKLRTIVAIKSFENKIAAADIAVSSCYALLPAARQNAFQNKAAIGPATFNRFDAN